MRSEQAGQGRVSARFAADMVREWRGCWVRARTLLNLGLGAIIWRGGKRRRGSGIGCDCIPSDTLFATVIQEKKVPDESVAPEVS